MYMILPGCRTLKDEMAILFGCFKNAINSIVYKIYELDCSLSI